MVRTLLAVVAVAVASNSAATPTSDNQPAEPFRIADHVYYVGASDIASYLVTAPAGHILIDAGYDDTAPQIRRNVERLGFKIQNVKILLNTQAHFDHAGGFAELKKLTHAELRVSGADADLIERGGRGDFLFGDKNTFPPATVDKRLKDGDQVTLGGVVLTAHITPGHTKGCTTWTFDATDRGKSYHVIVVGGTATNPGTRVSGMPTYPDIARDYAHTFEVLKQLPCDIFLGAHAGYYAGQDKAAKLRANPNGPNPFVDPAGYRAYVERAERSVREQMAKERIGYACAAPCSRAMRAS